MFKIVAICRGGGYRYCRTDPPHPRANAKGLYPLHRVKVENRIGRLLAPSEVVHHIDGDKSNDDDSNLALMLRDEHATQHARAKSPEYLFPLCGWCLREFRLKPYIYNTRMKQTKKGELYCCKSCASRSAALNRQLEVGRRGDGS